MKKSLVYFLIVISTFSCEEDNSTPGATPSNSFAPEVGQGGSLATFTLKGSYLYVVDESVLNVFDITTPDNPVEVNNIPVGFQIETLFSFKEYLYIGSRNGMFIYSLANPEFPTELSSVSHFTACDPVVANDSNAFVTLHTDVNCGNNINVLEIYDITTVTNPVLISSRNLATPKGLGLFENYLVVCDDEIKIFDIRNPSNSTLVNSINKAAFDVIIKGNFLIAIGKNGLYQYELKKASNSINVEYLSSIEI